VIEYTTKQNGPRGRVHHALSQESLSRVEKEVSLGVCEGLRRNACYHTTEDGRWDYRVTIVIKRGSGA